MGDEPLPVEPHMHRIRNTAASSGRSGARLDAILDLLADSNRIADIGTDHARVPIRFCSADPDRAAIAVDIAEEPLLVARKHIARAALGNRIQLRKGDGLVVLSQEDHIDTVVIAGMGGPTVVACLTACPPASLGVSRLVLQPHSEIPAVRRLLYQSGWSIDVERVVEDSGRAYVLIAACHREPPTPDLTDIYVGPVLRHVPDAAARRYLRHRRTVLRNIARERGDAAGNPQHPIELRALESLRQL